MSQTIPQSSSVIENSVTVPTAKIVQTEKETESADDSTIVARGEDSETVQKLLHKITDETLNRLIDTIDKAEYDLKEVSVQFSESQTGDNLPICYMPKDKRPYIRVKANQVESHPLLDSGADMTVLSYVHEEELEKYNAQLESININITTVTKPESPVAGLMWVNFQMAGDARVIPILVIKSHKSYMIVGIDFLEAFDIRYIRGNGIPKQP